MTSTLAGNLDKVDQRIREACHRAGRPRETVTLVAVSKFQSPEAMRALAEAGVTQFAESRVQEAISKVPRLPGLGTWHFIGHLQTNKAASAAELFDVIQSVDSLRLAVRLDAEARALGRTLRVFVQVNASGEPQKHGAAPTDVATLLKELGSLPALRLEGLMGMGPLADPAAIRACFRSLAALRDSLQGTFGPLKLSMGMSDDFEIAVEEGADLVRIGSALFGGRAPAAPLPPAP